MNSYQIHWKQPLANWEPLKVTIPEPEIVDLTEARAVLAEIMSKKFDK
jgi:hypothetical protein